MKWSPLFPSYQAVTHPPGSITPAQRKTLPATMKTGPKIRSAIEPQQHRCSMATVTHSVTMLTVPPYESSLGCPGLDLLNEVAVNVGTDRLLVKRGIWDLPLLFDCDLVDFMVADR